MGASKQGSDDEFVIATKYESTTPFRKKSPVSPRKFQGVSIEELQAGGKPLTKKQKVKKHLRRFWGCYLVLGFVGLAAGLPIL